LQGTFLVRPSLSLAGAMVLSVVVNGAVKHMALDGNQLDTRSLEVRAQQHARCIPSRMLPFGQPCNYRYPEPTQDTAFALRHHMHVLTFIHPAVLAGSCSPASSCMGSSCMRSSPSICSPKHCMLNSPSTAWKATPQPHAPPLLP
jgi:hypothetical protein